LRKRIVMLEIAKGATARKRMKLMALGEKKPRYTCSGTKQRGRGC
jgi:hypothetical protein